MTSPTNKKRNFPWTNHGGSSDSLHWRVENGPKESHVVLKPVAILDHQHPVQVGIIYIHYSILVYFQNVGHSFCCLTRNDRRVAPNYSLRNLVSWWKVGICWIPALHHMDGFFPNMTQFFWAKKKSILAGSRHWLLPPGQKFSGWYQKNIT